MPTEWFCQIDHDEFGPMSSTALRELAAAGRLASSDRIRRGRDGKWVTASRVAGLFEDARGADRSPPPRPVATATRESDADVVYDAIPESDDEAEVLEPVGGPPRVRRFRNVRSINQCISKEERKQRLSVMILSILLWIVLVVVLLIFAIASWGVLLIVYVLAWAFGRLFAEYNVRKLQSIGTAATPDQFPEIADALNQVCTQFNVEHQPKVIVLNDRMLNAFALKIAQKRVIVLLSETLEGVLDQPAELRFFLGHELAHILLDHSWRGFFERYKPARYRAAREMTCDNCGCACAGDVEAAATALKRLGCGNTLYGRLNDDYLEREAEYLYSGISGWFLKQYLRYPPLGKRLANVREFAAAQAG
jgi:Zn-dependent protease with chaperone function